MKERIEQASFDFCDSTNRTTTHDLGHALNLLRQEMIEGIIEQGESNRELTKRVKKVFQNASQSRAETIAVTEASRAYHAAQEQAAIESNVVQGFELLLSSDACPLCRKIYSECRATKPGQAFAIIGEHSEYSVVRHPPLHPRCQCSLVEILKPAYGGPDDQEFGATLYQPQEDLENE